MKKSTKNFLMLAFAVVVFSVMMTSASAKESSVANSRYRSKRTAVNVQVQQRDVSDGITLEQAKEIAIEHAGADSASAVFNKEKLDNGVYELKFQDNNGKYEYKISAVDGQILDCDLEIEKNREEISKPVLAEEDFVEGAVSVEEVCQIAQDAAGLSEENLKFITCYISWREHEPYAYEVKFAARTAPYYRYHYTIDLYTGEILGGGCVSWR